MSNRLNRLQSLNDILRGEVSNREVFANMISEAISLVIDERDLAAVLSTSRTTINRWKNGKVMPHAMVVKMVVKELRSRVTPRLNQERQAASGGSTSGLDSIAAGGRDY